MARPCDAQISVRYRFGDAVAFRKSLPVKCCRTAVGPDFLGACRFAKARHVGVALAQQPGVVGLGDPRDVGIGNSFRVRSTMKPGLRASMNTTSPSIIARRISPSPLCVDDIEPLDHASARRSALITKLASCSRAILVCPARPSRPFLVRQRQNLGFFFIFDRRCALRHHVQGGVRVGRILLPFSLERLWWSVSFQLCFFAPKAPAGSPCAVALRHAADGGAQI